MTSQNATTDDIGDIIDGDETAPLEPSPRSPVEVSTLYIHTSCRYVDRFVKQLNFVSKVYIFIVVVRQDLTIRANINFFVNFQGTALVESGTNVSPTVESNGLEEGNEHMTSNTNGLIYNTFINVLYYIHK